MAMEEIPLTKFSIFSDPIKSGTPIKHIASTPFTQAACMRVIRARASATNSSITLALMSGGKKVFDHTFSTSSNGISKPGYKITAKDNRAMFRWPVNNDTDKMFQVNAPSPEVIERILETFQPFFLIAGSASKKLNSNAPDKETYKVSSLKEGGAVESLQETQQVSLGLPPIPQEKRQESGQKPMAPRSYGSSDERLPRKDSVSQDTMANGDASATVNTGTASEANRGFDGEGVRPTFPSAEKVTDGQYGHISDKDGAYQSDFSSSRVDQAYIQNPPRALEDPGHQAHHSLNGNPYSPQRPRQSINSDDPALTYQHYDPSIAANPLPDDNYDPTGGLQSTHQAGPAHLADGHNGHDLFTKTHQAPSSPRPRPQDLINFHSDSQDSALGQHLPLTVTHDLIPPLDEDSLEGDLHGDSYDLHGQFAHAGTGAQLAENNPLQEIHAAFQHDFSLGIYDIGEDQLELMLDEVLLERGFEQLCERIGHHLARRGEIASAPRYDHGNDNDNEDEWL